MTIEEIERLDLSNSRFDHDTAARLLVDLMNGDLDPDDFETVKTWVRQCYNRPSHVERAMVACDEVLGTHGVEGIFNGGDWHVVASYCNTGETYAPTVLYCHQEDEFIIASFGDYVEAMEEENEFA